MNILALLENRQAPFVGLLKSELRDHFLIKKDTSTKYVSEAEMFCSAAAKKGKVIDAIICIDRVFLEVLVNRDSGNVAIKTGKKELLHLYRGSVFWLYPKDKVPQGKRNIPILVLPDLVLMRSQPEGRFLVKRYLRKLLDPTFPVAPTLTWDLIDSPADREKADELLAMFSSPDCILIGVDIETKMQKISWKWEEVEYVEYDGRSVRTSGIFLETDKRTASGNKSKQRMLACPIADMSGYCGIFRGADGTLTSHTVVVDTQSMFGIEYMRKFNAVPAPKVMHNGRYDSMYFLRMNAPITNWKFDTYMMMHAWYAELRRSLEFVGAFMIRNHMYWKDEVQIDEYLYNAKDCHTTAWACLYMMHEMPDWAKKNFLIKFPEVFPCIQCGGEGFKTDPEEHKIVAAKFEAKRDEAEKRLGDVIVPHFNAGSPKQVKTMMHGFPRTGDLLGTDSKTLTTFAERHPLYRFISELISEYRGANKAVSTYMEIDFFAGRLMYELDPSGTDSGRFASKASSFWCGTQVQNIPPYAKSMYVADDGWVLGALDYSQSESRSTAYISEDPNLMVTVETAKDFHTTNCSLFFGIPEDELWLTKANDPKLYKGIRNTGKRVNHGANYNMGARVMLDTMGTAAVVEAKHLLNLPSTMKLLQVCEFLLECFSKAYPLVKGKYYQEVIAEIAETSMLVGETGWTRWCFDDPRRAKPALNKYVAHNPQSLSVMIMNKAFYLVWWRLQIVENKIRIKAQIHDEIVFQYKQEDEAYVVKVIQEIMHRPVTVRGRQMVIPTDAELGGYRWIDIKG